MGAVSEVRVEWLRARAALAELDEQQGHTAPGTDADEEEQKAIEAALDRLRKVEWRLLQTPATSSWDVRERAEIVLEMFAAADKNGPPSDNRHRLMLSVLVNEILTDKASD